MQIFITKLRGKRIEVKDRRKKSVEKNLDLKEVVDPTIILHCYAPVSVSR